MNVGIATVVEFLQKKGYTVEANPNTKITEEQYAILVKEFSTDKNLRIESERFIQERQNKDRNKASVAIDGYEKQPEKPKTDDVIKTVVPEDARPKFKPVGKIDLNKFNRKTDKEAASETKPQPQTEVQPQTKPEAPKPAPAPVVEEKKVEEVVKPVVVEAKKEEVVVPVSKPEPVKEAQPVVVEQPKPVVEEKVVEEVKKEVEALGAECLAVQADVGNSNDCQRLFKEIESRFGHVDVLVNNAGISIIGLLQDLSFEDWNRILSANLSSVFHCTKLAIPGMIHNHSGKIINISSVWGVCGASCEAAYSATKGGVNGLTMALAKELAPSGIQVNAIACGAIDTEMNGFLSEEEHEMLLDEIPAGRMGKPEEVADLVLKLVEAPDYLTGQVIKMDGGWI